MSVRRTSQVHVSALDQKIGFSFLTVPVLQNPVISIVSFVIDGYETRLRQLLGQSCDLEDLAGQIPAIRGQFLAQYGVTTSCLPSSSEVEFVSHPTTALSEVFGNDCWLEDEDFVLPTHDKFGEWALRHDEPTRVGFENAMLDPTDLEACSSEETSALHYSARCAVVLSLGI
jgi:hypothetical protein